MAFKIPNRSRMSISGTPGTGDVTLNALTSGYQTLASAGLSDGDTFPYVIEDGANWEIGVGTYHASGTSFTRTTVRGSSSGGTTKITVGSSAIVYSSIMGQDVGSGGGGGGSAPTIVQYSAFTLTDAPCVMASTPTVGNLLIAVVSHWSVGAVTSGWTPIDTYATGIANDYLTTLYKVVVSGDTTSQSPITATYQSTTIFEISGATDIGSHTGQHDITSTTPSLSLVAPANALVLGQFSTTTGAGAAPTSITGATQGTSATSSTGSNGSPRAATPFYSTTTVAGGVTITATYATASNTNLAGVVVRGN